MGAESTSLYTQMKHLANLLRNKAISQQNPSIYEDKRPKSVEDTEKTVRGLLQDNKVPGTNATVAPGLEPAGLATELLGQSRLMAPSPAKQGLSTTERHQVA